LCPFCTSQNTRKYGKFRARQRYKCNTCKKTFGSSKKPQRFNQKLFDDYCYGKQTLSQIGAKIGCSIPTIQKRLDEFILPTFVVKPRPIILVMDALYFGKKKDKDGLLVGKDWITKQIIYYEFIQSETKAVYQKARNTLEVSAFEILAVITDGRPGIKNVFSNLPLQMCQFHLIQIVNRYITKRPKLIPALQLRTLLEGLTTTTEYAFKLRFNYWLEVNEDFLNEKTVSLETGRKIYKHKRLRSAVRSIQTNLEHLFICKNKTYSNLHIPNTTNCLDGWFAHLRKLLGCHNGLRKDRRNRVIKYILATHFFN